MCRERSSASCIALRNETTAGTIVRSGRYRNLCPKSFRLYRNCPGSKVCSMPPVTPAGALVGRDNELASLTRLIREVARGRGGSVLIEGEPGIGKSALVRAAVAGAPEAGCQVFWGAGDELGQALPLLPFLDGLQVREPST